ncbi:MAG: isoaspartyl peptidase/L-asparaginase, partial [Gemmatimonadota bacterium]
DHIFLVGRGALKFARSFGFEEEELLTDEARGIWLRWRGEHGPDDDWGPPDHLRGTDLAPELGDSPGRGAEAAPGAGDDRSGGGGSDLAAAEPPLEFTYGTTNVLGLDSNGDLAGVTTTSGLSWKVPGRVGDSPIIGAGLYVDNEVGAAGATGRGEDVIKSCATHYIVMRMRDGRTPREACEDALELIAGRYRGMGLDFLPGEKFVALNKAGEYGCARMRGRVPARMTVHRAAGQEEFEGTLLYPSGP